MATGASIVRLPFVRGFFIGAIIGLIPATLIVLHAQPSRESVLDRGIGGTFLARGIITAVEPDSLIIDMVSPYSPYEKASFRLRIGENTSVWSVPPIPGGLSLPIGSPNSQEIHRKNLVKGQLVFLVVNRWTNPFYANTVFVSDTKT